MRPVLAAALAAAVVAALAALGGHASRASRRAPERAFATSSGAPLALSLCPPGSLPDDGVCIPAPPPGRGAIATRATERIPRRPDRAPEYAGYALPVEHAVSIAELGDQKAPDGGALPSGIAIEGAPGAAVSAVALDGQEGPATVLYRGKYWGLTVVTLHSVQAGGRTQQYLVTLGQLGTARPLEPGATLAQGGTVGTIGPSLLVLQTRLLRPGIDVRGMPAATLNDAANSVPTDPRNVLGVQVH